MEWMLDKVLASIFPADKAEWQTGLLSSEAYANTVTMMKRTGMIREAPPFEAFSRQEAAHVP
jgi:hypothetical protein